MESEDAEGPAMTPKEEMRWCVDRIADSAPLLVALDQVEQHCKLLRSLDEHDRGLSIPHEEVFDRIEKIGALVEGDWDAVRRLKNAMAETGETWSLRDRVGFLLDDLGADGSVERLIARLRFLAHRPTLTKRVLAAELGVDPSEILDELPDGDEAGDAPLDAVGGERLDPACGSLFAKLK